MLSASKLGRWSEETVLARLSLCQLLSDLSDEGPLSGDEDMRPRVTISRVVDTGKQAAGAKSICYMYVGSNAAGEVSILVCFAVSRRSPICPVLCSRPTRATLAMSS